MAAPTNSGESDMANEDIFSNLSPLPSPRCILPLRATPSPPWHFLPSSSSMVVQYQGSTSGTSDEAIEEEFDVTIYFNIPSSPSHVPTLSLQRPFLPSMVVYQPSNHSMENLPQKQLQHPYTWLQLREQLRQRLQLLDQHLRFLMSLNNPPNLSEAMVDDDIGIGGVGTWDCEMEKVQTPGGERENKRTTGVQIAIPLEDIPQTKGVCFQDAAMNLNVSRSTQLNPDTLPSDQTLAATIDTNNTVVKETLPLPFLPTAQQKILDVDFGIGVGAVGMGSERTGDSEMEDEFNLVSRSRQLNPDTLPSNQASAATIDTNSPVVKEIVPPLLLPTAQQENLDEDFGNGVEAVGMGSGRTQESETEDEFNTVSRSTNGQLNSRNLGKRKREKMTPGGERRNKKTNGVRIAIPLEDILQTKKMLLKDAAKHLKVSKSTLKRVCRGYDIHRWPPRGEHKPISQSCPNESPAVVDKEQIPQLKSDTLLPSNQVSTTTGTESVTMKARFGKHTIKFQLSWPFGAEELKQQVKRRLELEAGTYYINYKDEDNDDILIGCDEDLQDHISRSRIPGTNSIEVFLQLK